MNMKEFFLLLNLTFFFHTQISAQMKTDADLVLLNGKIYTADKNFRIVEALALKDGKFLEAGTTDQISAKYSSGTMMDISGLTVYPGFIDGHCHFYGYAKSLQQVDLAGSGSFEDVLDILKARSEGMPGEWLVGRGWDNTKWIPGGFPDRSELDSIFPDRPVVLIRIDGHAVLANGEALKRAGIGPVNNFIPGEVETRNGKLTGILLENASDLMRNTIPEPDSKIMTELIRQAQANCYSVGLAGVADAGLEFRQVRLMDSLQDKGILKMNVYAMLAPSGENIEKFVKAGLYRTGKLNIRSIKLYADGSLGSRTALLTDPYSDDPANRGILTNSEDYLRRMCDLAFRSGYQVNTHAIGDSAVRLVCEIYREFLKGKNDLRWRIEHAQVVNPSDLSFFEKYSIIPSIQATHATSDMHWAGERLGGSRVKWAYAYNDLLRQNEWIINGTDFPIENISPILTFYASVSRKDLKGTPREGFQKENALSREDALRSISIWAAKGCFEESERGSIEMGKTADFVILDKDIMTIPESEIPGVMVRKLFLGGAKVYEK